MKILRLLSSAILAVSTGPVAVAALLLFLAFGALVLPGQAAAAERVAGGAGSPDTLFFYTPEDLLRQAEAYGQSGRDAYVRARWTFDLAFPAVYGLFLLTSIGWCLRKALAAGSAWQALSLVPVAAVLLDLLENTMTSLVMARYPGEAALAAALAPWMTLAKWVFVYGSFGLLFVVLAVVVARRLRRKPAGGQPA
jgi:hypothetical protein